MQYSPTRSLCTILVAIIVVTSTGCSSVFQTHPPGDRIGSLEGQMRLTSGNRVPFRFDLFAYRDDTRLYFSVPGKYHYRPVEDIGFDGGRIGIELRSPHRIVEGELTGSNLKFSGQFQGFSGLLNLKLGE